MQRFTGWLLLIVVLCGLGVLMYQDMRLRTERTEIPSAITAGTPEGAGDESEPEAAAPVLESLAPSPAEGGKASVAETPSAGALPDRAMASAEPPPAVEMRAAAEAPPASVDAMPGSQSSGGGAAATSPAPAPASSSASATHADGAARPADAAASPTEPPAAVATESVETPAPVAAPTEESAPVAADVAPESAPPPAPEAPAAVAAAATAPTPEAPPTETAAASPAGSPTVEDGTEVAVAPEIETQPQPGTPPPASESSNRDSMMQAEAGTEPPPQAADTVVAAVDTSADVTEPAPAAPDPVVAAVDPSADVEAPRPAAVPDAIAPGTDSQTAATLPSFDVVRVEPTGDAVVAGVAPPGAMVELIDGTATVATAVASDTGEWAMALDQPLSAGEHDLALRATSDDTGVVIESEQRVAVLVPETVAEEPLVVLNAPDAASTILQVPAAPAPADVAALDTPVTPDAGATLPEAEGAAPPADGPMADAASPPPSTAAPEPATDVAAAEPPPATPTAPAANSGAPITAAAADATAAGAPPAEPEVMAATPLAEPAGTPSAPAATEPATSGTEPAAAAPEPATDVAAAEPPPAAATVPDADSSAPTTAAADTTAAGVPPAEPEVVAATPLAEPAAPAATEPLASGTEPALPDVAVAEPAPEPEPEPEPVISPVVVVTAVEAESSGALFVAGTATTPEDVRVYVDDVLLGEVTPSPSGTWLMEVERELPAGTYRVRADQVEPGAGTVLARAEVPFERDVEVAILRPVAEAGAGTGAEATGTITGPTTLIIKRSDNLWRISRQLYGKGIRWSTIYEANKDQIRNPRFIYPGQVFVLPEGNAAWAEEAAD